MKIVILKKIFSFGSLTAIGLFFLIIGVAGCVQTTEYIRPPIPEKESGLAMPGKFRAVAIADLDNDGIPDIVGGASEPGTAAVWYGTEMGFVTKPYLLPFKGDVRSVSVADMDHDGLKDIILAVQRESTGIMVWKNNADRRWSRNPGPTDINHYQGIVTADINGDGWEDIVAANSTTDRQGGIQVWLGNGSGKWPVETGPSVTGVYMDVALADFNEDGVPDLVGAGWGTYGSIRIWLGDRAGTWSSTPPLVKGSFYGVSAADINRDSHMDILAASYRAGIYIFLGNGKGEFRRVLSPVRKGSFWMVLPVDLDHDGSIDILASSIDSKGIMAWRNNGPDNWMSLKGRFPSNGSFYQMAAADLNKDGIEDISAASFGEGIKTWTGKKAALDAARRDKPPLRINSTDAGSEAKEIPEENDVYAMVSGMPEYKIGAGDILEITIWKGTTGGKEIIPVKPNGTISFGFIDDLYVHGLTATTLDKKITKELKKYIKTPRIDVIVKEYKSKFVTVMGALGYHTRASKGKYELKGRMTLLEMLSDSVGVSKDANLSNVRVRRKSGQTLTLDLYKAINQGDLTQDIVLNDRDFIYVPAITKEARRVYVFGEVEKPGVYTFTGAHMTLFDAISQAGGVSIFATSKSTKIVRGDVTRPEVLSSDLKKLLEEGDQTQNVLLANGDLVYVPRSFIGDVNLFVKRITPLIKLIGFPLDIDDTVERFE